MPDPGNLVELRTITGRVTVCPEDLVQVSEFVPELRDRVAWLTPKPHAHGPLGMFLKVETAKEDKPESVMARLGEWGVKCIVDLRNGKQFYCTEPYQVVVEKFAEHRGGVLLAAPPEEKEEIHVGP